MQKLIFFCFAILAFAACKTSKIDEARPACIKEKIDDFTPQENSRSVQWTKFEGDTVYKFSTLIEEFYLDEKCDTLCDYALYESFLPPCKFEIDNAANWKTIWQK